jgi:phage tail sheath protein FI
MLLNRMLGLGSGLAPYGLEQLLRHHEVSLVALPELDATETVMEDRHEGDLPPRPACFGPCTCIGPASASAAQAPAAVRTVRRLYRNEDVLWAQQYLLERLERTRWRWFALLAPPPGLPVERAVDWRQRLTGRMGGSDLGALYWPWLLVQDSPGAPVETRSPIGAVAGIFGATDIAEGPHAPPANKVLTGVVGLETPVGDRENRLAYDAGVNLLRHRAGRGIHVWGARSLLWQPKLSAAEPLAFVPARRSLSAIARTAEVVGQPLVFEPSTPILRIRLHQIMTDYMLSVYETGALKGAAPEEAFFVKVETVEDSAEGSLECTIGVALAAPAEFIEFRIGREGGVVETAEAA